MTKKLLALYGLKWNPFLADVPPEALFVSPGVDSFAFRLENLVREGGFALITGDPGTGKVSVRPSHVRTTRKILDERVVYGVAGPGCQRSGRSSRMRFCGHPSASLRSTSVRYGRGGTSY